MTGALKAQRNWDESKALAVLEMPLLDRVLQSGGKFNYSGIENFCHYLRPKTSPALFFRKFRYCPKCIDLGYHSTAHQVPWLDRCLIHQEPILDHCQNCGKIFELGKGRDNFLVRYRCQSCGEMLWHGATIRPWQKGITQSDIASIAQYVDWVHNWKGRGRIYTTTEADVRCGRLGEMERSARIGSMLVKPQNVCDAWRKAKPGKQHTTRFPMGCRKAFRIFEALNYLGIDSILRFANANWTNLYGIQRRLHRRIAANIEQRHSVCFKEISKAKEAAVSINSWELLSYADCLCTQCLLAKNIAHYDSYVDTDNYRAIEDHRSKHAREIEWLVNNGLLRATRWSGQHLNERPPATDRFCCSTFMWVLDADLVRVLNHCNVIHHLSWARGFLQAHLPVSRLADLEERVQAMSDVFLVFPTGGSFVLPSFVRGELVIHSLMEDLGNYSGMSIFSCSNEHSYNVSRRVATLNDLLEQYRQHQRLRHIELVTKLR